MTTEELKRLPKIELHCHLDGSLGQELMQMRLGRPVSKEELSVSETCESLNEYLEKFELPGRSIMDETGLYCAGYDVLRTMSMENVCYAEIRFAPLLSVTDTMGVWQILKALLAGLEKGKEDFQIAYNVIVCAMRHHSEESNYEMLKIAKEFLGKGVCAADLAGAEALYPMSEFMGLFEKVSELGMPFTIHAGEQGSAENIEDAIRVGAKRIGHGIAMRGNKELQALVKEREIAVEMCPISNLQTKAVKSTKEYPLREFLDAGILVTVNTDNRTVSDTSLTKELAFIQNTYGVSDEEILLLMKNAVKAAFTDEQTKAELYERLAKRQGVLTGGKADASI